MSQPIPTDKLRTTKLNFDEEKPFSFNDKDKWLNEILGELVDELKGELKEDLECSIKQEVHAHKHQHYNYRDVVLVKGDFSEVPCVIWSNRVNNYSKSSLYKLCFCRQYV